MLSVWCFLHKMHNAFTSPLHYTANDFKTRFRNHTKSINNKKYQNETEPQSRNYSLTELSKYIWQLRDSNRPHNIKWGIIKKIPPCKPGHRRCGLCLEEKLLILKGRNRNTLNKTPAETEIYGNLYKKCTS